MSAPFRINQPSTARVGTLGPADTEVGSNDFKGYLDRLMKMIPGEAVGLYLVGNGFIPSTDAIVGTIWAVICLIGVILLKAYGTSDEANKLPPDWVHVGISAAAFVIWVYTMGGPFEVAGLHVNYLGSLLVLAWTFFVPIFYKGAPA